MTNKTWAVALIGLLIVASVVLTGCAEPAAIAPVEPTATTFAPPTDIPVPEPGPTPAALDFPLAAPPREEVEEEVSDQGCIDCHTDVETLKAVAEVAEVEEESLSEGEG